MLYRPLKWVSYSDFRQLIIGWRPVNMQYVWFHKSLQSGCLYLECYRLGVYLSFSPGWKRELKTYKAYPEEF